MSQFFSVDTARSLVKMNEYYPTSWSGSYGESRMHIWRRCTGIARCSAEVAERDGKWRQPSRKKTTEGTLAHVRNMDVYFDTPHKRHVAERYRNFFLQVSAIATPEDFKHIYEGLVSGDPKMRTFGRSIIGFMENILRKRRKRRKANMDNKLTAPLSTLQWVPREWLKPNDYNPNKVSKENLKLLTQSILVNGWTLPIVVRPDYTIIDGFHRWTVSGEEPLKSMLNGKVPIVVVEHSERSEDIYGTVTHNRGKGTHLLEPMKAIVKRAYGGRENRRRNRKAARYETRRGFPVIRLLEEDFLNMMTKGVTGFSKAEYVTKI